MIVRIDRIVEEKSKLIIYVEAWLVFGSLWFAAACGRRRQSAKAPKLREMRSAPNEQCASNFKSKRSSSAEKMINL